MSKGKSNKRKKSRRRSKQRRPGKADFRRRTQVAAPADPEIERRLRQLLSPAALAPMRASGRKLKLRERLLSLPVMVAIVLSLVWRQIPSLSEVVRVLAREGLLWLSPMKVSKQAVSARFEALPATLWEQMLNQVIQQINQQRRDSQAASSSLAQPQYQPQLQQRFSQLALADASTLEELMRKSQENKEASRLVAGKMMMLVSAFDHVPLQAWYTTEVHANERRWADELLAALPVNGLMIFDLGFFSFPLFDDFTEQEKYVVTRMREKTAYRTVEVLSQGPRYRDEIIRVGVYRARPCHSRLRMVSVLWGTKWYRYLTNVLDPQRLSAQMVCELYRGRWRIEEAFLLTKRLLGLSYFFGGSSNAVQIQVYATWIFYAVLVDLCRQVSEALSVPLPRVSVEMVFRGLYHYSRAVERGETDDVVAFYVEHAKLLSLVKAIRKRHRLADQQRVEIWGGLLS